MNFLQTLCPVLITKMIIFQIKLLNEINFFLILIYLSLQFKIVHVFPLKFLWITSIQIALLLVNWPPQCIATDHTSIGLKRVTIQLVVSEVCCSVFTRFSHHNTSQVCTATLNDRHWRFIAHLAQVEITLAALLVFSSTYPVTNIFLCVINDCSGHSCLTFHWWFLWAFMFVMSSVSVLSINVCCFIDEYS